MPQRIQRKRTKGWKAPEGADVCWYCAKDGTDHNHGTGRSCGDCCATHGGMAHESPREYAWVNECLTAKNERIATLEQENKGLLAALEAERRFIEKELQSKGGRS